MTNIPPGSIVVRFDQPFGSYARTLLLPMGYPGNTPPYDTCSHNLPLLMGVKIQAIDRIDAYRDTFVPGKSRQYESRPQRPVEQTHSY